MLQSICIKIPTRNEFPSPSCWNSTNSAFHASSFGELIIYSRGKCFSSMSLVLVFLKRPLSGIIMCRLLSECRGDVATRTPPIIIAILRENATPEEFSVASAFSERTPGKRSSEKRLRLNVARSMQLLWEENKIFGRGFRFCGHLDGVLWVGESAVSAWLWKSEYYRNYAWKTHSIVSCVTEIIWWTIDIVIG